MTRTSLSMRSAALLLAALPLVACMQADAETASGGPSAYGYTLKPAAKPRAGIALPLGKCINMGGMMERPKEGDLGRPIRESDFRIIRDGGFRTVRLPIVFSAHTGNDPPYTIDPAYMARVKRMVSAGLDAGLNVMVDVHAYKEMMDDPEGETARFTAIWRQIAQTFRDAPKGLWFELLNEPTNRLWNKVSVWTVYRPALAAIRKTNPTRPVIVAGNLGSRVDSLASLQMPDDPYLVPTVHMYDPKEFTHQGANWTINRYKRGRAFLNTDRTVIDERVAAVKAYMDRTGRVPFLGEYGAIDDASIKPAERVKYYGTVSAAFASIGVQNCAWSYVNGFNLYKNGTWVPGMLKAIQTTTTIAPK